VLARRREPRRRFGILTSLLLIGFVVTACGSSDGPDSAEDPAIIDSGAGPSTGDPDTEACMAAAVTLGMSDPVVLAVFGPDPRGLQCSIQSGSGAIVQVVVPADGSPPATVAP
jgi:hypothetical protein